VATDKKLNKPILVDSSGKAVYLYEPEGNSTTSQVPAGIKGNWPAVTASGAASVSSDLDASKVGTSTQSDGTTQVTYNGHLLYLFVGDTGPAEANGASGQALGGIWFVLSPDGEKIA
jgi:predicted lipoprotein with Yx(FWY)xxD motif